MTCFKLRCGDPAVHTGSGRIKQRKSFVRKASKGASLGPWCMALKGVGVGREVYWFPSELQWQSGSRSSPLI